MKVNERWLWLLLFVVTEPSVPTAMGRMVGMVTFIFVAAGSPSRVPSEVEDRLTLEVPVPPETSTVVGSAADAPMARLAMRQTARTRETIFLKFFIVKYSLKFYSFDCLWWCEISFLQ